MNEERKHTTTILNVHVSNKCRHEIAMDLLQSSRQFLGL